VQSVAICGGAGSFSIGNAKAAKADIYLTGDLKYHDFQQAESTLILADIGHFESEQFVKELIYWEISEKFSNFVSRISAKSRGFVLYI
jgi:putative NIF3 family GTP cyclohydrolase 1 type 2